MILTGDLHANLMGELDFVRPGALARALGKSVLRERYLIILGDGGFLWDGDLIAAHNGPLLQEFDAMPWTTLVIPGNHENFPAIYRNDNLVTFEGQPFYRLSQKVLYFKRFGAYELEGRRLLILGGARSIDKDARIAGKTWFSEEVLSAEERREIMERLPGHYDAVLAHTAPESVVGQMFAKFPDFKPLGGINGIEHDRNAVFFDALLPRLKVPYWFFGHFHHNAQAESGTTAYRCLYKSGFMY